MEFKIQRGGPPRKRRQRHHDKPHAKNPSYWSAEVTRNSDALDLEKRVFSKESPREIAKSLKRSAERSRRRKSSPYRSAMSMLTFYINRAGASLSQRRRGILERAKEEVRKVFRRG